MSSIDDVKARLDIVDVVGGYVSDLKKSGRTWKARCPFHNERTPSFVVDPGRGTWHCFGACSTGGDVIEFVRRSEHLEFREALKQCAERAGVELRPPSRREVERREAHDRLLAANEAAAVYFQAQLRGPAGADALRYVEGRGLDAETVSTWQLGYAPDEWQGLTDHLRARGFSEQDLREAGLGIDGERGLYDRFRGRLVFPIRDRRGRLSGFGARALGDDQQPKYLNTPQTALFEKSGLLYGLDRAGEEARRADRLVVVEGYMDVIGCHQFGIRNVVASMGTAITERQMGLAQRYTSNLVLALDADNAGSEAALRGVEVAAGASEHGTSPTVDWRGLVSYQDVLKSDIRVAALPEGEDPDSLVRQDATRLRELLEEAKPVTEHLFDVVTAQLDQQNPRDRSRALEALSPTVAGITDPVVRSHYVQRLARLGRVDEPTVMQLLQRFEGARRRGPSAEQRAAPVPSRREVVRAARGRTAGRIETPDGEAQLLQLLLLRDEAREAGQALDENIFEDSANRLVFGAWRAGTIAEREQELEDEVRESVATLRTTTHEALGPEYLEAKYVDEAVRDMAAGLRVRRRQQQLLPVAVAQAVEIAEARRSGEAVGEFAVRTAAEGAVPAEVASEASTLAAEFADLSERQRVLSLEYRNGPAGVAVAGVAETGASAAAPALSEFDEAPAPAGAGDRDGTSTPQRGGDHQIGEDGGNE